MIYWLIIVIAVVSVVRANRRRQQDSRQGAREPRQGWPQNYRQPVQQSSQRPPQQNYQRAPQQGYQRPPQQGMAHQQASGRYSRMPNPKQSHGNPAPQAAGPAVVMPGKVQERPDDILSRAAANVQENAVDELLQQRDTLHLMPDAIHLVTDEPGDLIRQVHDLIVMGYQADLSFERDFVAEGVELLARCEVQTELPEVKM